MSTFADLVTWIDTLQGDARSEAAQLLDDLQCDDPSRYGTTESEIFAGIVSKFDACVADLPAAHAAYIAR